jgi:hypothetical protein
MPYLFRLSKGFISPQSVIILKSWQKKNDFDFFKSADFEGFIPALIAKSFW